VTILQFRHNLADREAAQAVADRISWKYALGLTLDYAGFDFSALSEFRSRLAQEGRADRLLSLMLERLKEAGLVKAGDPQRTDSTHVIACVRRLNRIETLGEGLRAAMEEIARTSPGFIVPLLRPGWDERYGRKVETSRLLRRKNASADKLVEQIGVDGLSLLDAIDADPTAAWMNQLPQVTFLRTLWDQHFQQTAAGRLRYKDVKELPPASERLHSPYDPDARYSTKGDTEWVGCKAHLSESCDEGLPHVVTDVHTTGATDPDVTATTAIQDRLIARDLAPDEHLMDAGYPPAKRPYRPGTQPRPPRRLFRPHRQPHDASQQNPRTVHRSQPRRGLTSTSRLRQRNQELGVIDPLLGLFATHVTFQIVSRYAWRWQIELLFLLVLCPEHERELVVGNFWK
jgi:hypothetical protein